MSKPYALPPSVAPRTTRHHILWVGGLDRAYRHLESFAARLGHTLEVHDGKTHGRGVEELARRVARADVVVIVVEVNSHGAALLAKSLARREGTPAVTVRKGSVSVLQRVIAWLDARAEGSECALLTIDGMAPVCKTG